MSSGSSPENGGHLDQQVVFTKLPEETEKWETVPKRGKKEARKLERIMMPNHVALSG